MNKIKGFLSTTKGKIIAGAATLLVIAAVVVIIALANRGYRSIIIDDLNGTTTVSSREAFKGQNLKSGDNVAVGEKSDLTLALDTDKHVYADENTRFRVEAAGKSGENSRTVIHLEEGSILSEIDNKLADKESYIVETPNATMAVRGTVFSVIYDKETNTTIVFVVEGIVHIETEDGSEDITAGEERTITGGGTPPSSGGSPQIPVEPVSAFNGTVTLAGQEFEIKDGELSIYDIDLSDEDMKKIGELTGLLRLHIGGECGVSDITPLAGLTNLIQLEFRDGCSISDITPIAGLTNLRHLSLGNNISDLTPIAGLTSLETLWLNSNNISDLTPLSGLTNLRDLNLENNNISDLTPLAGLKNLEFLELNNENTAGHENNNNNISDITPLTGLTNLIGLDLSGNNVSNITPLAGLTNLTTLELEFNDISDITPLAGLTDLKSLYIYSNNISDIAPLAGLANLTTLELYNNEISDITPLAKLTNLKTLNIIKNNIPEADIERLKAALPNCDIRN